MGYTRNFGFRSFENLVRDGRFRVPKEESYAIGSPVTVGSDGFLTRPAEGADPSQLSGIVLFEHIQMQGVDPFLSSPQDGVFQFAPAGQYAQMVHGQGAKVWFRDVGSKTMYDGRTQENEGLVTGLGDLEVGDGLAPGADGEVWKKAGLDDTPWLEVQQVNPDAGLVECRLTF